MPLYNCKTAGEQWRITKFDNGGNVDSSYLCTHKECQCPAGQRAMCRHREMLPKFIARGAVNVNWMFDYDRGGWVDNRTDDELEPHSPTVTAAGFDPADDGSIPSVAAIAPAKLPPRRKADGRRL